MTNLLITTNLLFLIFNNLRWHLMDTWFKILSEKIWFYHFKMNDLLKYGFNIIDIESTPHFLQSVKFKAENYFF